MQPMLCDSLKATASIKNHLFTPKKSVEMMLKTENECIREAVRSPLLLEGNTHTGAYASTHIFILHMYIYGTTERFETRQSVFETIIRRLLHGGQSKLL